MQCVFTGSNDTEDTYLKQAEKNAEDVNKIFNHMGLSGEGNISEIRRLGSSLNPENKEKQTCRAILKIFSNTPFLQKCFARDHHLQSYKIAVFFKKFLPSIECQSKKESLSKKIFMIQNEGKSKEDFQIKNFILY